MYSLQLLKARIQTFGGLQAFVPTFIGSRKESTWCLLQLPEAACLTWLHLPLPLCPFSLCLSLSVLSAYLKTASHSHLHMRLHLGNPQITQHSFSYRDPE